MQDGRSPYFSRIATSDYAIIIRPYQSLFSVEGSNRLILLMSIMKFIV